MYSEDARGKGFYSRVSAYKGVAVQGIPSGVQTLVDFDTELYDTLGEFDIATDLFTPLRAGYYLIIAQVWFTTTVANADYRAYIRHSVRGTIQTATIEAISVPTAVSIQLCQIVYLMPTDTINIACWQNSGVNQNVFNDDQCTFLMIHRLS